jgi:hypothetical protein
VSLEQLVSKYIDSAERVLAELKCVQPLVAISETDVEKTIEHIRAYVADAKYYKAQKRFETSLTSVAYCEGLLDALKLLGLVKFEWPTKQENEK